MYKKFFVSFADSRMNLSLIRISQQASKMNFFDIIHTYDENILSGSFKRRFKNHLVLGSKGFGYWVWKPYIILKTLQKMKMNDILLYCDAGCHLNRRGFWRIKDYFNFAKFSQSGLVVFQAKPPEYPLYKDKREYIELKEREWTKGDLFDYFKVRNNKNVTETSQIGAGVIIIKKTKITINLFKKWLQVFKDDFNLVDDSLSKSKNLKGFIEHRHDQSVFGILCKLLNSDIKILSSCEYFYPSKFNKFKADWKPLKNYPILAKRDKCFEKKRNYIFNFLINIKKICKKLSW